MERKVIAVCVVAGVLGLIAVILSFAAEGTRIKASQVYFTDEGFCIYPKSASMSLGIAAAIFLLIEQIIISVATRCMCCCGGIPRASGCRRITTITCFIFSWLVFHGAFTLLIKGAVVNNFNYIAKEDAKQGECLVGAAGLFAVGGVLAIVSIALGLIAYLALMTSPKPINTGSTNLASESGVPHAKPQMPASN